MHTVYYHPACFTSYKLLRLLREEAIDGVELVNVERSPHLSVSRRILTVPLIFRGGEAIYGGPIDLQVAKEALLGRSPKVSVGDVQGALIAGVADSAAVSALVLAAGSLLPLLELKDFIVATTGLYFDEERDRKLSEALEIISSDDGSLFNSSRHKFISTLVYNKAREDIYLGIDKKEPEDFLSWFVAKASVGRAGVPFTTSVEHYKAIASEMHSYYVERKDKIKDRLLKERAEIEAFMRSS